MNKKIKELKEAIEKKQHFLDQYEDVMQKIQADYTKMRLFEMKEELKHLQSYTSNSRLFSELSDWIMDEHCAMRIVKGGNPENVADRVAFIEKTPRVRLARTKFALEINKDGSGGCLGSKTDAWIEGPKGSGQEYGRYEPSREWCDSLLIALGWE